MKLAKWLESTGVKKSAFARDIGKTPAAVIGFCKGDFKPSVDTLAKIRARTANAVTDVDFMQPEAAE